MSDGSLERDWTRLLDAMLDGTITAEEHAQLERALASEPDLRRTYFRYVDLHLGLRALHGGQNDAEFLRRLDAGPRATAGSAKWWLYAAAAVVTIAATGTALTMLRGSSDRIVSPPPAARLAQHAGAKFYGLDGPQPVGSPMNVGQQYVLTDGSIHLAFTSGAEAIITAPAVFEIGGPMRLAVALGKCSVHAEGEAEGFLVETPRTQVIDRGTRFSVEVGEAGDALVQVSEGKTEVFPRAGVDPSYEELTSGMARVFPSVPGAASSAIPFDADRFTSRLPDRIVTYRTTKGPRGGAVALIDVTVQRGGRTSTYAFEELIGARLTHFKGAESRFHMTTHWGERDPYLQGAERAELLAEPNLNNAIINPGGSRSPLTSHPIMNDPELTNPVNTAGFAVRFDHPVVNGPGPDVVLFELQVVVHPEAGDFFHVSPVLFEPGLRSHTITRYDINMFSPEAVALDGFRLYLFDRKLGSLDALEQAEHNGGPEHIVPGRLLAVGIDLSDLGFAPGATARELFFQDVLDDLNYVDPVLIVGLPAGDAGGN